MREGIHSVHRWQKQIPGRGESKVKCCKEGTWLACLRKVGNAGWLKLSEQGIEPLVLSTDCRPFKGHWLLLCVK